MTGMAPRAPREHYSLGPPDISYHTTNRTFCQRSYIIFVAFYRAARKSGFLTKAFAPHSRAGCNKLREMVLALGITLYSALSCGLQRATIGIPFLSTFSPHSRAGCNFRACYLVIARNSFSPHSRAGCNGKYAQDVWSAHGLLCAP